VPEYADQEIYIDKSQDSRYAVVFRLDNLWRYKPGYLEPRDDLVHWVPGISTVEDSERLSTWFFADEQITTAWTKAPSQQRQARIRLCIDASACELHAIPWELLDGASPQRRSKPLSG